MQKIYFWPLDPASRQVRLALAEKRLRFESIEENPWRPGENFYALNPTGRPPVFIDDGPEGRRVVAETHAILEYLEEVYPSPALLPDTPVDRAEVRRLVQWFDGKYAEEVNAFLLYEKIEKRFAGLGSPDPAILREGRQNLRFHLDYITWLADRRNWLGGRKMSYADLVAAAHLSCSDYLGDVPWEDFPVAKSWYQRLKSRPGFRALLKDKIPGMPPASHYTDLDF